MSASPEVPPRVDVPAQIHEAMLMHSRYGYPEEACGLLAADQDGLLRMAYCLTNAERSESSYTVDPTEHFRALQHAESQGWTLAGVFHSHPHTDAFPSKTDLRLAAEPDWLYFIVGLNGPATMRAFLLDGGTISEVFIQILD
jgi:proteasome lid subunit RPN8/RPN11